MKLDPLTLTSSVALAPALAETSDLTSAFVQWGIGGIILLAFVLPSMRRAEKREDARDARDLEEARSRGVAQERLMDTLRQSVNQQSEALVQWRVSVGEITRAIESQDAQLGALITTQEATARLIASLSSKLLSA
jgi:uncharacterized protein YlxW (UPF0749 family)